MCRKYQGWNLAVKPVQYRIIAMVGRIVKPMTTDWGLYLIKLTIPPIKAL